MNKRFFPANDDFRCLHCRTIVSADPLLTATRNRNHCPYCLYSRHLDLHHAGDRLSACKGAMRPSGLTLKRTTKKYGSGLGELMIIHVCQDCGQVSINRIAADDDAENLLALLESTALPELHPAAVLPLEHRDRHTVARLLGFARQSTTA